MRGGADAGSLDNSGVSQAMTARRYLLYSGVRVARVRASWEGGEGVWWEAVDASAWNGD